MSDRVRSRRDTVRISLKVKNWLLLCLGSAWVFLAEHAGALIRLALVPEVHMAAGGSSGPHWSEWLMIAYRFLPLIAMQLVTLCIGLIPTPVVASMTPRSPSGPCNRSSLWLVGKGLRFGIPYGVGAYFLLWWSSALPSTFTYSGFTPHALEYGALVYVLVTAMAGPCEEIFFRGFLLRIARDVMGLRLACLLNVLLFIHWHRFTYINPTHLFIVCVSSVSFLYLALRYRSLWPAILAHSSSNAVASVLSNT